MKNKNGFTLVELLAVIALIGVIMLLVAPKVINVFNDSKKTAFYDEVVSLYNNAYTTYASRLSEGDTSKRYCLGEDETLNKLEIKDKNNFYYDIQLNNEGKVIKIKVKNKNYNISISNSNGLDKSDIKVESVQVNDKTQYLNCSGEGLTLTQTLLRDNPIVSERTDFSPYHDEPIENGTIYKTNETEDGSIVYYYYGNINNNWFKFANYYWRIIRTNENGGIRLLFVGKNHDTIDDSKLYSTTRKYKDLTGISSDPMYVGFMYGTSGSLENNRTNENISTILEELESWYEKNISYKYEKYISMDAIYCNDRSIGSGTYSTSSSDYFRYGASVRLSNKTPSYKCGGNGNGGTFATAGDADKFSVSKASGGNGELIYPIALITLDEIVFAGGPYPNVWYFSTSTGNTLIEYYSWWTMTPINWNNGNSRVAAINGAIYPGSFSSLNIDSSGGDLAVMRPVISLDKCVKLNGTGTATDPYVVDEDASTC